MHLFADGQMGLYQNNVNLTLCKGGQKDLYGLLSSFLCIRGLSKVFPF